MIPRSLLWPIVASVLGFFLGGSVVWGIYYNPAPATQSALHEQQEPTAEQPAYGAESQPKGSYGAPFFVQVVPTPKPAQERAQEAEEREEKKNADRWLVRWTAALFAATIGLILATGVLGYFAYRQSKDMQESVAAAKRSADLAERSFTHLERPYLFISDFEIYEPWFFGGDDGIRLPGIKYRIVNGGRTPAVIKVCKVEVNPAGKDTTMPYMTIDHGATVIGAETGLDRAFETAAPVTPNFGAYSYFYFTAQLTYDDVFGFTHATKLVFSWLRSSGKYEFRQHLIQQKTRLFTKEQPWDFGWGLDWTDT